MTLEFKKRLAIHNCPCIQDYRNVLEDYMLFHIVVMKQDVRTLLVSEFKCIHACFQKWYIPVVPKFQSLLLICVLPFPIHMQLNVHKPVREVIDSVCFTFGICNPSEYHLWIPTGIQYIMEKYGGKPVS